MTALMCSDWLADSVLVTMFDLTRDTEIIQSRCLSLFLSPGEWRGVSQPVTSSQGPHIKRHIQKDFKSVFWMPFRLEVQMYNRLLDQTER